MLNRANRRATLFARDGDYTSFIRTLAAAIDRDGVELFAYCVMPNHWHLVVRPPDSATLTRFVHWMTTKHALAWHAFNQTAGSGHVYQGRYKAFPVQTDEHFLVLCRYVERNPVRAGLVKCARDWRWSSHCSRAEFTTVGDGKMPRLSEWPVQRPANWGTWVDEPQMDSELCEVRRSIQHATPYGAAPWRVALSRSFPHFRERRRRGRPLGRRTENGARPHFPFHGK